MIEIQLFKDLPNEQSLEAPFEIIVQNESDIIVTLIQVQMKIINYEWNRIIIEKEKR